MELIIQQVVDIPPEAVWLLAYNMILLQLITFSCRLQVDNQEEKNYEQSEYSV